MAFLIENDGTQTAHPIVGPAVVGSAPAEDAEVVIGVATMITIDDPSVHEVHVRIKVDDQLVTVEDAGFGNAWIQSGNGPMTPLGTLPQPLTLGSQLRLGDRTLTYRPASARPT